MISPPLLFMTAIAGWLAGGLGNLAADALPRYGPARDASEGGGAVAEPAGDPAPAAVPLRHLTHTWTLPWYPFGREAGRGARACPRCGHAVTARSPLLELSVAAAFLAGGLRSAPGDGLQLAAYCLWAWFFLTVAVIDLEHRRVLNIMLGPAAGAALLLAALRSLAGLQVGPSLPSALLGGAAGLVGFFLIALLGRGKMGMGDVKLAGVIGLATGWPGVLYALVFGIVAGGLGAVLLILAGRAGRKSYIAYAPYLSLGALAVLWPALG